MSQGVTILPEPGDKLVQLPLCLDTQSPSCFVFRLVIELITEQCRMATYRQRPLPLALDLGSVAAHVRPVPARQLDQHLDVSLLCVIEISLHPLAVVVELLIGIEIAG